MEEIIRVEKLDVGYEDEVVLKDLNFNIHKGDITVILGRSGCGKTTILKTLLGLLPAISGDIIFFGEKIDYLSEKALEKLYKRIGVLYQGGALLNSLTLYENVALPIKMQCPEIPPDIEKEMVYARLAQVGLAESVNKYPAALSGGMRKRTALARAMILDPEIIFCDEPSAGLDPITALGLDVLMQNLRDFFGITFLVVTHELRSIEKISDRAMVLNNGHIHYFGDYKDIFKQKDPFIETFFMKGEKYDN
ncbi:MAG: ATP-binding cassette domain-containing protein [Acidobacteria bacterium]|jgi:phospholipid/cholesterol/gamma-HCH transport system ATP-binding protein|nr:ATP-binding cassette domain-containing protein [Acidobacteriota bacterium]